MERQGRLLLDTGSGISLIKENILRPEWERMKCNEIHTFSMGNDIHSTKYTTILTTPLGKQHEFIIVPPNFPLKEDGIIELNFLDQYNYNINKNFLTLDRY